MRTNGVLQLDFDGTLAVGDVSTGILGRFVSPAWVDNVEQASRALLADAESPALIDAMTTGFAQLLGDTSAYLAYARANHPARRGLRELIDVSEGLGLEAHVVSNGFEFYIRDYLRAAGVEGRVQVHTGEVAQDGTLVYLGPEGHPVRSRFKVAWAEHFLTQHDRLIYVGDGSSDIAAASLASTVFARDSLLTGMPASFKGELHAFETLHDVAKGLLDN